MRGVENIGFRPLGRKRYFYEGETPDRLDSGHTKCPSFGVSLLLPVMMMATVATVATTFMSHFFRDVDCQISCVIAFSRCLTAGNLYFQAFTDPSSLGTSLMCVTYDKPSLALFQYFLTIVVLKYIKKMMDVRRNECQNRSGSPLPSVYWMRCDSLVYFRVPIRCKELLRPS